MGNRALENRINKILELETTIDELKKQADAIKSEIRNQMEAQGADEIHTPNFVIRFKEVISNRFDTKRFKADHEGLYGAYMKPSASMRFTIA